MLCRKCEQRLSKYENYAARMLRGEGVKRTKNTAKLYTISGINYHNFRLFGLSILWRAHISQDRLFEKVKLGRHADRLRTMILNDNPGKPDQYPFFIGEILGEHGILPEKIIMQATTARYEKHRCYRLPFYGFVWMFIVSSHKPTELIQACAVSQQGSMLVTKHKLGSITFMMNGLKSAGKAALNPNYRHMRVE